MNLKNFTGSPLSKIYDNSNLGFLALDFNSRIKWASKDFLAEAHFTLKEIEDKNFRDMIHIFKEDKNTGAINCKLIKPYFKTDMYLTETFHLTVQPVERHDDFALFSVQFIVHATENVFTKYDKTFYAVLDDGLNIIECSNNLHLLLSNISGSNDIFKTNLFDYLEKEDLQKWKDAKKRLALYASEVAEKSGAGWRCVFDSAKEGMSSLFGPLSPGWRMAKNMLSCRASTPSFLLARRQFDFFGEDFKVEFSAENGRGGVTLCASDPFFETPDENGYLIFVNKYLIFKRNGQAIYIFPEIKKCGSVVIEKSGILVTLYCGGKKVFSYVDDVPFYNKELQNKFGLYALTEESWSSLKVFSRKSFFDYEKLKEHKVFIRFRNRLHTFFDMQIYPGEEWEKPVKILKLTELSELKKAEEQIRSYKKELDKTQARLLASESGFRGLVGKSLAVENIIATITTVAKTEATVLITGETGVGKDIVARAIHEESGRSGPFIKLDCASLPINLIESELFGHEKGAYTGADRSQAGKFELANQGTLFIDEIGNLSLELQMKLLRFLQDRQFERLGGQKTITSHARIIAATNVDLEKSVARGAFRSDLFYRIKVIQIDIPPLRERMEDIYPLIRYFLQKRCMEHRVAVPQLDNRLLPALFDYSWPGNVRELANAIEQIVILEIVPRKLDRISIEHFPPSIKNRPVPGEVASPVDMDKAAVEEDQNYYNRDFFIKVFHECKGKPYRMAEKLDCSYDTVKNYVKKYGINKSEFFSGKKALESFGKRAFSTQAFMDRLGISFPTAKKTLDQYVGEGKLARERRGKKIYFKILS